MTDGIAATRQPECSYDRTRESLGNVVELQHVNLRVPDQLLATQFYISGLGLTRDPYLMTGVDNMWANAGISQFHLPTNPRPQRLRGTVGLVLPHRGQLLERLARLRGPLDGTLFAFAELGTTPVAQEMATPDAHRRFWQADIAKWRPIIQAAGQYAD